MELEGRGVVEEEYIRSNMIQTTCNETEWSKYR